MPNYNTLVTDIKNYMEDDGTEFSAAIDTFIDITELKLSRDLVLPAFRQRATSSLSQNDAFITLPADLVVLENLHLVDANVRKILLLRSDEFMMEFWPNRTQTGTPKYYSYYDNSALYVAPTPSSNLSIEISYRRRLPALGTGGTSSTTYTVAVVSYGGANKFILDSSVAPTLTLSRGNTYIFDQSDSTNATHQIAFRTSDDSSYNTGVTNEGVLGQAGAKTTFVVPSDAPSSLKYYCTTHGNGMGANITVTDSTANLTNWLTDNAYDVLLYGCLVEAGSFNRNDAMVQKYLALYQTSVQAINKEGNMRLSIDNFYQKSEG